MTVAELIAELQKHPPEMKVIVTDSSCCGCGAGFVETVEVQEGELFLDGDKWKRI